MKVVKKIDILSCAKITGIVTGGVYLVAGLFINVAVLLFGIPALSNFDILGFGSGVLATFLVALLVGSISFVLGAIWAWLYNLAASLVGGVAFYETEREARMFKPKKKKKKGNNAQDEVNNLIGKDDTFSSSKS